MITLGSNPRYSMNSEHSCVHKLPCSFPALSFPSLPDHHIWVQHSNIGKILNFFPQLRIKHGNKVLNSDFRSRNCKEHYLQGVRHMKICPCLSSQILKHSHLSLGDQPSTSSALFSPESRRNQLSRNSDLTHSTRKVFDFQKIL